MRKIRLDDSRLNHLTNIPVGFTRKSSYIHSEKSHTKNIMYFADRGCVRTWRNLYRYATVLVQYSRPENILSAILFNAENDRSPKHAVAQLNTNTYEVGYISQIRKHVLQAVLSVR